MGKLATVRRGIAELPNGTTMEVGLSQWFDWLQDPDTKSFRVEDGDGFTCRKESGGFWYGYRKVESKLHKRYLGKSVTLNLARLTEIGDLLAIPTEPKPKLPSKMGNLPSQELLTQLGNLEAENAALKAELEAIKSERGYLADLKRIQKQTELEERNRELTLKVGVERKAKVEAQTELERLRRDYGIAKAQLYEARCELEELKSPDTADAMATPLITPVELKSPDTIDYRTFGIRELKAAAKAKRLKNYGTMNKAELIRKLTKF